MLLFTVAWFTIASFEKESCLIIAFLKAFSHWNLFISNNVLIILFCVCSQFKFGIKLIGTTNQVKISTAFLATFERAHSFKSKHLKKWRQTLTVLASISWLFSDQPPCSDQSSRNIFKRYRLKTHVKSGKNLNGALFA